MDMNYQIGVIGAGFVGQAVAENLSAAFKVKTWDIDSSKRTIATCADLVKWADVIFVCVPTPIGEDGHCNTFAVSSTVHNIASYTKDKLVVIKSTVPPYTTRDLSKETGIKKLVFNPEFLTQRNHINDFRFQDPIIIGSDNESADSTLTSIYTYWLGRTHRQCNILHTGTIEAELFKYVANSFLATKVVFANEMKELCYSKGINYEEISRLCKWDKRLGNTHWDVPGPDGQHGYGGACFPKDVAALLAYAKDSDVDLEVLEAASNKNNFLRF